MTAAEIARALRGRRYGQWWRCRCPVHGGKQQSLALQDGDYALIVKCWADCERDDVLTELDRLGLFDGTFQPRPQPVDKGEAEERRQRSITQARDIWERAREGRDSPIERWFQTRGIDLPVPLTLRWVRSCWHPSKASWPAMVARVDNVDGEFIGIRRTYLLSDGSAKAPVDPERASLGPVAGGAVRLAPLAGAHLLVGEGIETCLSAMEAAELPVWAAGDTSALKNLVLPAAVRLVTILADNDADIRRGPAAARTAAQRWLKEGRKVRIAWPRSGKDFNDIAMGASHAAQ